MAATDIGPEAGAESAFVEDEPETTYDPSEVEVTRGREQGLGVGARDLQLQRDPERPTVADDDDADEDEDEDT